MTAIVSRPNVLKTVPDIFERICLLYIMWLFYVLDNRHNWIASRCVYDRDITTLH